MMKEKAQGVLSKTKESYFFYFVKCHGREKKKRKIQFFSNPFVIELFSSLIEFIIELEQCRPHETQLLSLHE